MRNVHERVINVSAAEVGALVDRLGGEGDVLWPSAAWVPLLLDRPLAAGADGGHGPIRYRCEQHEPGRRARFVFHARETGVAGWHEFTVDEMAGGRCLLRHVLQVEPVTTAMRVGLPLIIVPLHDALLEDLLDNAERAVTGTVRSPARWSPQVRTIRRLLGAPATKVDVPDEAELLAEHLVGADLVDAWRGERGIGTSADPQAWADAIFRAAPPAVGALLAVRNALVGLVGIERSDGGAFDTVARSETEVLLGEDKNHLDFRCSVLVTPRAVTVSTAARANNTRGRLYLKVISVAHPIIVRSMLRRAVTRAGDGRLPGRADQGTAPLSPGSTRGCHGAQA